MTSLVITAALCAAVWGFLLGLLYERVANSDPLRRELSDSMRREKRWQRLAQEHRGTPYRPETVAAARLPRDDEWSKKVPARLEVVQ